MYFLMIVCIFTNKQIIIIIVRRTSGLIRLLKERMGLKIKKRNQQKLQVAIFIVSKMS